MKKSVEIIPAVLPEDFGEIAEKASLVKGLVRTMQVDVCDGHFVPNTTWPYGEHGQTFQRILSEEEGLPYWEELDYEFDLMIDFKSENDVEDWVQAGAARVILHAESKGNLKKILELLTGRIEVGLALNTETPLSAIDGSRDLINFVQFMGIDRVGFQGQSFNRKVIQKVRDAKRIYPSLPISVDGGVSLENYLDLQEAGADRLVIGSAIFGSDNPTDALKNFLT